MAFVDWHDNYTVHDAEMDAHHQRLFAIVNDLHQAMFTKQAKIEIEKILARLVEHTQTHFAAEERLMQARGYAGFALHKAEHERLLRQLGELGREFHKADSNVAADMLTFLIKDWLVGHILSLDKDYSGKHKPIILDTLVQRQGNRPTR